jgi:hypothetical protein
MQFPAFIFAGEEMVVKRADAIGASWAASWRAMAALPDDGSKDIASGDLVVVHPNSLDPFTPCWRLFGASFAISEALRLLDDAERPGFRAALRETPWGALAMCLDADTSVEAVTDQVRGLFPLWDALATLRYIGRPHALPEVIRFPGFNQESISFDALVGELFEGTLAIWGPQLGPMRAKLESAIERMAHGTFSDARTHIATRMAVLANRNARFRGTHAAEPAQILAWIDSLPEDEQADLVAGCDRALLAPLFGLLRRN